MLGVDSIPPRIIRAMKSTLASVALTAHGYDGLCISPVAVARTPFVGVSS